MTHTQTELSNLSAEQKRALLQRLLDEKSGAGRKIPLSFAQQRLWFFDKLEPGGALYNVPTVLRLRGRLHLDHFRQALDLVVARHETLRTTFEPGDDAPSQKIHPPAPLDFPLADLSHLPAAERNAALDELVSAEIRRPFDLARDPVLRATLFRLGPEEHILALVIHHIASDEWSMRLLFQEWSEGYRALEAARPPALPRLPEQYRDYARRQLEWAKSEDCRQQLAYWRDQLRAPESLRLPADFPRPAGQTFRGALCSSLLPPPLLEQLQSFSRAQGCTLFMTLLAAFKVLLFRSTQQTDLTVGTPIAGRTRPEHEPLIGFFVNTLALRGNVDPGRSFADFLQQVRRETLEAYACQDLPFDKLVEELHPRRSSDRSPFVQVVFTINHDFVAESIFPGIQAEEIEVATGTAKFELTLVAKVSNDGLCLLAEYNTDLFSEPRIARLLGHFRELLAGIVAHPGESLARLNLLTDAERAHLLGLGTRPAYPHDECVPRLFEAQASKTPGAVAVDFHGETISYRELNERSNQLAHHLRQNHAGSGTLVGVYLERSIGMIVAFLGILKAGAAYVPLDLSYPRERLAFMTQDTAMPLILTGQRLLDGLPGGSPQAICLDSDWPAIDRQPRRNLSQAPGSDSLAYVIYTSGSTGVPKGVAVPHCGIARLVLNADYLTIAPGDRIAQAANASFDAATFEIWGALLNGACLVGIGRDTALSPEDFRQTLRAKRITTLFLTTALFNQLAREVPGVFSTLDTVLFGGEAVDPQWVRAVLACDPPKRLLHVYGPTENTTFSAWHLVREVAEDAATVPIGRPISNSELYLLDPALNPVPIGVPGELYVGGPGLACGYWNRPELTAAHFVPHPFRPGADARLYRTGDLARFDENLNVEFIGRLDRQVKLRGFRIELGEIETLLLKHPALSEALVMLREDLPGDPRLVAYAVPAGQSPEPGELKTFLRARLPDYMLPAAFVFLESFPLTPNGKIDRNALPPPGQNRPAPGKSFVAPRDATEQQLAKIFEKNLGVQPIGVADNFFELGGHSLLAVRVFSQIEKVFKKKLPLATLFRAPTIGEIAKVLREDSQAKSWSTLVDLQPKGSRPPFFWLHTLGGDGGGGFFYYRKLAELLGPDQPSFGVRSPQAPFTRLEEMARFYIGEIRRFQPAGPYFLGGFCFGGNVAFEMARQLAAAGQEIGLLVLLESSPPNVGQKTSWSATAAKYSLENFVENLKDFAGHSPAQRLALLKSKGRRLTQKFRRTLDTGDQPVRLKDVLDLANYPEGYVQYAETHWEALTHYQPAPYPGHLVLFRAKKQGLSNFSHSLNWDALAGDRVSVNVIPGTHESMLQEPNVQIVAAQLRQLLDHAHRTGPSEPRLAAPR